MCVCLEEAAVQGQQQAARLSHAKQRDKRKERGTDRERERETEGDREREEDSDGDCGKSCLIFI